MTFIEYRSNRYTLEEWKQRDTYNVQARIFPPKGTTVHALRKDLLTVLADASFWFVEPRTIAKIDQLTSLILAPRSLQAVPDAEGFRLNFAAAANPEPKKTFKAACFKAFDTSLQSSDWATLQLSEKAPERQKIVARITQMFYRWKERHNLQDYKLSYGSLSSSVDANSDTVYIPVRVQTNRAYYEEKLEQARQQSPGGRYYRTIQDNLRKEDLKDCWKGLLDQGSGDAYEANLGRFEREYHVSLSDPNLETDNPLQDLWNLEALFPVQVYGSSFDEIEKTVKAFPYPCKLSIPSKQEIENRGKLYMDVYSA